jgi:hypothetical protein
MSTMIQLDKLLKQYFVVKVGDACGAKHGEDYEEMKQVILDEFFLDPSKIIQFQNDSDKRK